MMGTPEPVELSECSLDAHELDMLAIDGSWEKHLLPWGEAWMDPESFVVVVAPTDDSGYPPTTKADWTKEEGPGGATRWVNSDGDVRYREPADAEHEPEEGNEVAKALEEGDRIMIDGTEGEIETLSDMGGGYYVAIRDDDDEVHTERVGPNHEFETPGDDGASSGVAYDRYAAEPGDEIVIEPDGLDVDELRGEVLDAEAGRNDDRTEVEWQMPDGTNATETMLDRELNDAEFVEGHEPDQLDPDDYDDEIERWESIDEMGVSDLSMHVEGDDVIIDGVGRAKVENYQAWNDGLAYTPEGADPFHGEESMSGEELSGSLVGVVDEEPEPDDLNRDERLNAAHIVTGGVLSSAGGNVESDWQKYGEVLDRMNDDELSTALRDAVLTMPETGIEGVHMGNAPLSSVMGESYGDNRSEDMGTMMTDADDLAPITSRMSGEALVDAVDEIFEESEGLDFDTDAKASELSALYNAAVAFAPDEEARSEIAERHEAPESGYMGGEDGAARMATAEDYEEFQSAWIDGWHPSSDTSAASLTGVALKDFGPNEDENVVAWTHGRPIGDVDTGSIEEHFQTMYDETQEQLAESGGEQIYRGVSDRVTTHGSLESWSTRQDVAEDFDDFIMDAEVDPEDVLTTWEVLGDEWPEDYVRGKEEWMVLGGGLQ